MHMVIVAQLAERWLVVPDVAGSNPVVHPKGEMYVVEQEVLHVQEAQAHEECAYVLGMFR